MYENEVFLITLAARDFVFSRLAGNGEEKRKIHDLALEKLQRAREELNKRKTQKAKIKEALLPIAWHPSRWWDWPVPEDEKKQNRKIVFEHLIC